ncbi:MAG: DNA mismatch repair protein MutS [Bdellovibrionaceae bacterium]|nr:DNA mismatch repair protein MutS [Pseudobdellovibrionaceae bacterium]
MTSAETSKKLTPLMQQYWEIKDLHPDEILLFRMGDFYEIFYEDAIKAAPIVGLTLTSRNKKSGDETPMCGFPHHSVAGPLQKLLEAGHRVAICDQVEDPALAKGLVKRAVTRRLSPGMVFDPDTLDQMQGHYMMAVDEDHLAFLDATTGEAFYYKNDGDLNYYFEALNVVEVIVSDKDIFQKLEAPKKVCLTLFDKVKNPKQPATQTLLDYVRYTQGEEALPQFEKFKYIQRSAFLNISGRVFKHLEVFKNYEGDNTGSLFSAIQRTCTPAGARKLKQWLRTPLVMQDEIERRLEQVTLWKRDYFKLKNLRAILSELGDLERRVVKIASPSCNPKDLLRLAESLNTVRRLSMLVPLDATQVQKVLDAEALIGQAIKEDVPALLQAGGFIRKGYKPELDAVLELADETQSLISKMEQAEKQATGISSLKIRYNSVFGFYIEVTKTHSEKVPSHYIRKQTLTQSERYTTEELQGLEEKVLSAKSKKIELELQEFVDIKQRLIADSKDFLNLCHHLSELDVLSSFAWLAVERNYCLPQFNDTGRMEIYESRHPVVEQSSEVSFRPNTIMIDPGHGLLITGPNMAGKSTIMRQVALTVILAQVGSYVPATEASLPVFEQIFTRIGASDSLSQGLSTFMVEMTETAELLKLADAKSLVILDEIGRGTSTYDGLSLAQAILENLLVKKCTFMFSTHYQELVALDQDFKHLKNVHMGAIRQDDKIIFQYVLKSGPAEQSYGIDVAKLAGVPGSVTRRAGTLLKLYESQRKNSLGSQTSFNMDTMVEEGKDQSEDPSPTLDPKALEVLEGIRNYPTQQVTPLEALNEIAKWQKNL